MAGIQGMATPESVGSMQQVAPQVPPEAAPVPPMPQAPVADARPSLDSIFGAQAQDSRPSLDAIFKGEVAPAEQSFMSRLGSDISNVASTVSDIASPIAAPFKEAVKGVTDTEHPLAMLAQGPQGIINAAGKGFIKGFSEGPTVGDKVDLHLPESVAKGVTLSIPAPTINTMSPELQDMAAEQLQPKENQKPYERQITPGNAIDLAIAAWGPDAVIAGAKRIPTVAKLMGKAAGEIGEAVKNAATIGKAKAEAAPIQAAAESLDAVENAVSNLDRVQEAFPITKAMADPSNPEKMKQAIEVANNPEYSAMMDNLGEALVKTTTEHIPQSFANLAQDAATSDDIYKVLQGARGTKGGVIGELKTKAIKASGDTPMQAPLLTKAVNTLEDMLTTTDPTAKLVISNEKQEKELLDFVNKMKEDLFNNPNGVPLHKWEEYYQKLSEKSEQAWKANKETKYAFGNMRKALSADQNPMLGKALAEIEPEAAAKFSDAKGDFSSIMRSYDKVGNLIKNNDIASDALLKNTFFSTGAKAVDKTNAVLNVLGIENPKMVADLRGKAVQYLFDSAKVPVTPKTPLGLDLNKVIQGIRDLKGSGSLNDTNMLNVLTGNQKASEALLRMADTLEQFNTVYSGKQTKLNETLLGRLLYYGDQASLTKPSTWAKPVISTFQRNATVKSAFEGLDLNKVISVYPKSERKEALVRLKKLIAESK